jgi:hypothetical protein
MPMCELCVFLQIWLSGGKPRDGPANRTSRQQLKQWQYPVPELSLLQLLLSKVLAVPGSGAVNTFAVAGSN